VGYERDREYGPKTKILDRVSQKKNTTTKNVIEIDKKQVIYKITRAYN